MVSDRVDARVRGGVRGRIGLQLCDPGSGRVVHSVERENYVAQRMLDVPAEFARFGIVGVENPNSASAATWMPADGAFRTAPFTGLVVTDFDGEIDLNERSVGGTVTGYASKGVSGQGTQRGTYNALESEHRFDYHRFVYDFATSEANGTIQSIYTGPWNSNGLITDGLPRALTPAAIHRGNPAQTHTVAYDPLTGTVYRWRYNLANATVEKTSLTDFLAGGIANSAWSSEALPTGSFLALTVVGPRLYWLGTLQGSAGSRTLSVYSAPVADLQSHRLEHTWDAAFMNSIGWTANQSRVNGLVWMPDRETFILGATSDASGSPSAALYEFDPDDGWALVRAFDGLRDVRNGALSALPGSPNEILTGVSLGRLDDTAGTVSRQGEIRGADNNADGVVVELSHGMGIVTVASGPGTGTYFIPVQQFFSRARLDEPVVKTSTLTMKITYEFTMDPPVWLP